MNKASDTLTAAVLAVFRANGLLLAWGDRFVAPLGLTSARWQMMGAIALAASPLTAPMLAAAMGVSRQGAQKQLDLLVEDGLAERQPNPAHQRSPLYLLTPQGRSLYERADRRWREWAAACARRLPAADVRAAERFLAALSTRLASELKDSPP